MADSFRPTSTRGTAFSFVFGAFIAANLIIGKELILRDFNPFQLIYLRSVFYLPMVLIFPSWDENLGYQFSDLLIYLGCITASVVSWILMILSFKYLEVGDSGTIEIGSIILFTVVLGYYWLSESIDKCSVAVLVIDVIGVFLIGKPSELFGGCVTCHKGGQILGVLLAIIAGFLSSVFTVSVKLIANRQKLNVLLLQVFHGIVGIPLMSMLALFSDPWNVKLNLDNCLLILAYQLACLGQTIFMCVALKIENANNVSVSSTISCVITYLAQLTIFRTTVDWIAILGSFCVITVVVILQLRR